MKINMTTVLTSLDGKPIEEMERYENLTFVSTEKTPDERVQHVRRKKLILRDVCTQAFASPIDSDKGASGMEKNKWFLLSLKIQQNDEVDLTSEEISLLKNRIGKVYTILIVGRSYELLDPITEEIDKT